MGWEGRGGEGKGGEGVGIGARLRHLRGCLRRLPRDRPHSARPHTCARAPTRRRYADNIVKCFAAASAIITGTVLSVPIFGFTLSPSFALGAACTIIASTLYASAPSLDRLWALLRCGAGGPSGTKEELTSLMDSEK